MSLRHFLITAVIALTFLVIQFKLLPIILTKVKNESKDRLSPVEKVEQIKFELVYFLKDAGITIISGPNFKPEIKGIELVLEIKNRPVRVIFSSQKDGQSQLASLQLILKKSKILTGKQLKVIDLTGNKSYVSF